MLGYVVIECQFPLKGQSIRKAYNAMQYSHYPQVLLYLNTLTEGDAFLSGAKLKVAQPYIIYDFLS